MKKQGADAGRKKVADGGPDENDNEGDIFIG